MQAVSASCFVLALITLFLFIIGVFQPTAFNFSKKFSKYLSDSLRLNNAIVFGVALILLVGVGFGTNTTLSKTSNVSKAITHNKPVSNDTSSNNSTPTNPDGQIGSEMVMTGDGLNVTLTRVIDPATGDPDLDTIPSAGNRFIAADFTIQNTGKAVYSDDANSDAVIIGSDGQTYNYDPSDVNECTNFNDGDYNLTPGESVSGCVVFQIPNGVNVLKVQFTDNNGTLAEWTNS